MDVLVGLIGLVAGVAVCLVGLRLFFVLLPIWGFIVGFLVGAAGVTAIFGDGFLSTTLGIVIGLIVGIIFAVLSYLFWYVGALLAAGSAGWIFGESLFAAIGVDTDWVLWVIGLLFAVVFVAAALLLNLPVYIVIVSTAMSGAGIAIGGILLVFDKIDRDDIGTGATWERIHDNWWLWLIWLVAAGVGVGAQIGTKTNDAAELERWTRAQPGPAV
ncbi:MAG TPA: DUF4203 domain-containing protein [Thermomicrobiales bacterium]|jgi:hypothetical protein